MSRGFVKEEDQEEVPIVPPRADLPEGITNYVTPGGMQQLLAERETLARERENIQASSENERRIAINHNNAVMQLLNARIASAKVVNPLEQPADEVRFGARITVKVKNDRNLQVYQIVGVDEADISKKKISFLSPIAKILINKKVGDSAILKLVHGDRIFKIMKIEYGN